MVAPDLSDCLDDARFELKMRYGVFAKKVAAGTMTQAQMDWRIACQQRTIQELEALVTQQQMSLFPPPA